MPLRTDGVKIPISLVHLKGMKLDGNRPLFLYGYGSYGFPYDIVFNSNIFSLVDRGVTFSRGAYSRWRRDGQGVARRGTHDEQEKYVHRLHRFSRVFACAELWVEGPVGDRGRKRRRIADGRGAEYAAGFVSRGDGGRVPFVDVINTMLDESLPLTVRNSKSGAIRKKRPRSIT